MRSSTSWLPGFVLLGLALAGSPAAVAETSDPEAYGDDYQNGDYGRLRFIDGGATIQRAGGDDVDDRAATNAPLFPGDRIRTERGQRVEIQLAGGSTVRLDADTDVALQSLPRPGAKFRDNTVLLLDRGVLRADVRIGDNDEFRIDTPSGSVYLLGDGDFRIEADPTGRTSVYSRRGVAEVVGEGGSVLVRGGSGTSIVAGTVPEDPRPFRLSAGDSFDRWVDSREASYRTIEHHESAGVGAEELPDEVRPYYRELSAYGRWVSVPDYGWAWSPYNAGVGWRPYNDGYWSYGPGGYFWVGNEPWGWAPYRYGRWSWLGGYGWFWVPGRVFAGAWVSWSWGSLYVGWAPLDYWGGPAYIGGPYYGGYYDPGCWTFVDYRHIGAHDVHRHAVPIARAGDDVRGRPAVARAARVSPRLLATSQEARERVAREAAADPRIRVRPIAEGKTPSRRLENVEARLSARSPTRVAEDRDPRAIRDDRRARPEASAGPGRATPGNRPAPGTRTTPGTRTAPGNRATATGGNDVSREVSTPSVQPPSAAPGRPAAGRTAREPLPRRIVVDPRAADSRERSDTPRENGSARRDSGARESTPRGTNEVVRELYDRLSRTGEMRRTPPRERVPEEGRSAPKTPRPEPAPPARAEPRREPVKPREQAQPPSRPAPAPRPESGPRPAPAKPEPSQEHRRGESKRDRR